MPEPELSLKEAMERLDVICEVVNGALKDRRVRVHDLRVLHNAADKAVSAYYKEKNAAVSR